MDWVGYSREERRKYLKDLLPFVCFPYLSTKYVNELRNNDLIGLKTEFGCKLFSDFLPETSTLILPYSEIKKKYEFSNNQ